jgi:hypothetical protein
MDPKLIEKFAGGGEQLSLAIRGLTRDDLLAVPAPDANVGKWSIQQVVIHCMDSDLIAVDRIKRRWRWHLLLKASNPNELTRVARYFAERFPIPKSADLRATIDRDPVALL